MSEIDELCCFECKNAKTSKLKILKLWGFETELPSSPQLLIKSNLLASLLDFYKVIASDSRFITLSRRRLSEVFGRS